MKFSSLHPIVLDNQSPFYYLIASKLQDSLDDMYYLNPNHLTSCMDWKHEVSVVASDDPPLHQLAYESSYGLKLQT